MAIVEAVLFGGIFGAGGVLMLFTAWRHLLRRREIAQWPRVDAEVLGHDVVKEGHTFYPSIRVRYHQGARTFVHETRSPTGTGYRYGKPAWKLAAKYPMGRRVSLYVHPNDGRPAYLVLPEAFSIVALTIGGVAFVGVALVALASAL
jgi:hypothetical protein